MRVIGMLFGIPEDRQRQVTDHGEANLERTKVDRWPPEKSPPIPWTRAPNIRRTTHDDLLNAEFEDETGTVRTAEPRRTAVDLPSRPGASEQPRG